MSSGAQKFSTNSTSGGTNNAATVRPLSSTDFLPPTVAATALIQSTKIGLQKLSKSTVLPLSGNKNSSSANTSSSIGGGGNTNNKSSSISKNNGSRGIPGNSALEFSTPKQAQLLSQCNSTDRTIWATRVLMGGSSVNGFLRATATAQRIKKQRARQNNSTKVSRAAKLASVTLGATTTGTGTITSPVTSNSTGAGTTEIDNNKVAAPAASNTSKANIPVSSIGNSKTKEIFNQLEEELLKKRIMNPRTAKKLKGELEAGLIFCATVCNVLRGVLFDLDSSLSPVLPSHLSTEKQPKPLPVHTFLIPSNHPNTTSRQQTLQRLPNYSDISSIGSSKIVKMSTKSKSSATHGTKGNTTNKSSAVSKQTQQQQQQKQQLSASQNTTSSPGDPGSSTLRKLRKTVKKTSGISAIFTEPAFVNLPPEFDYTSNKRTCTKKDYQYRTFQLLRYRDLKKGDFVAARLSSRDLWILAKVLKDYKTTSLTSLYTLSPVEFLTLSDARRDALFQKERVMLEDVEDQREQTFGTQVARNLVLPLARTHVEANECAARLLKKGSRVYAMYPQTTSLYAATVTDTTTYCRGDDDIIVVQFDGEEADSAGKFPSYHIPSRFVTLIPREFPASKTGSSVIKSNSASFSTSSGNKRKSATSLSGNTNKKRSNAVSSSGGEYMDTALPFAFNKVAGAEGGLGFDDLDLDFDKPLDEHEQQEEFSPF